MVRQAAVCEMPETVKAANVENVVAGIPNLIEDALFQVLIHCCVDGKQCKDFGAATTQAMTAKTVTKNNNLIQFMIRV